MHLNLMRHIAVVNQKGGVGKTTITANLGHALALSGHHVTVVDMDPQGQLSASLGLFKPPSQGIDEVMLGEADFAAASISTRDGLMLVPAGQRIAEVDRMQGGMERARLLKRGIERSESSADFTLYDLPPAAGLIMANAIMAVDEVLIPVTGDYLGLNGVAQLMQTLRHFEKFRTSRLRQWVMLSRLNQRRRLSREVAAKLVKHFSGQLLETPICEAAVMAECPGVGRTIFEYRPKSRSAKDFLSLAQDLISERTM